MNQCVPSWDIQENPSSANKLSLRSNSNSQTHDVLMLDYEVAELTWENGQLAMHGLGPPRVSSKHTTWDKPRASGTLESIVNQATRLPDKPFFPSTDDLVPWFDPNRAAASATMAADAMVPCAYQNDNQTAGTATRALESMPGHGLGTCMVGSCSVAPTTQDAQKRARVACAPVAPEWSGKDQSAGASASVGRDSQQMTLDTYDKDFGLGLTSTSLGSPENTSSAGKRRMTATATTADDHDSVCHSRPQRDADAKDEDKKKGTGKSSVSTKRSRAAAIHNQSERKRRDKINQRMKTLQKLVPNSSKTDKASMLDEVIEYMKQLQAQVQMMQRMNMPAAMMLPMAMQQQLQMSMMAPMGMMGMGMGVMDMNSIARPNIPGMSPFLHPSAFMPIASCDGSNDRLPPNPLASMPDPLSPFLACQSQPMNMDAYRRMAAMYQQHLQPPSNSKS